MSVVYIREQGAMVRKDHQQLRVTLGKRELFTIPLANLEQVVLMGNVQITTPAAVLLMREQVDVVFMSQFGQYRGHLMKSGSRRARLRHMQLRLCDDEARSLDIARNVVLGKVTNQRVLLQRRGEGDAHIQALLQGMAEMQHAATQAHHVDQLRGFEGQAARGYFEALRLFIPPEWGFKTREYYPPPDPANALLSFAYTMLLKDVESKIQLVGLDPYLGFFHALGYDRPALALDVMEEFRPTIADVVVLSLVGNGQITLDDFEWTNQPEFPVRMSRPAIDTLVAAYESRLAERVYHPDAGGQTEYRYALELQVRQFARIIRGEQADYLPLAMR